jgi:dihydroorotate dehydrogenase electron transfer subunit
VAPVQVSGPVLTVRRLDAYHALTMVAPGIATEFRPGQFLTVAVGGPDSATLARRAFSIHDVHPDHGGTVEFIFEADGPGTRWLAGRRSRDLLDVVGPLGRPFPLPREPVSCLLLGAGHGSTALFPLADRLRDRGCQIDFMLGAASADRVFGALRARRTARSTVITTEDGSLGSRGIITDMLAQVIHEARTDVIYASAPLPVLREVVALASRYDLPVQALVEQPTVCGTGVCMSCVLPVVGSDGVTRIVRACTDGPVFRADLVRWDDVGTIPFDALGAPGWKPPRPVPSQDPGTPSSRGSGPASARGPGVPPSRGPGLPPARGSHQTSRGPQAPRTPQPSREAQPPRTPQPPQSAHEPQAPPQPRGPQDPRGPRPPQARTPQEPRMTQTPRWARGTPEAGHGR